MNDRIADWYPNLTIQERTGGWDIPYTPSLGTPLRPSGIVRTNKHCGSVESDILRFRLVLPFVTAFGVRDTTAIANVPTPYVHVHTLPPRGTYDKLHDFRSEYRTFFFFFSTFFHTWVARIRPYTYPCNDRAV